MVSEADRIRAAYAARRDGERYSLLNPGHLWQIQELERDMLALLGDPGAPPLASASVLEVGCGNAYWLRRLIDWGARPENLAGVDLIPDRIADARHRCPADVALICADATHLQFRSDSFDVVLQSTMFTSILDAAMKARIASEMIRVARPEGLIIWYDYRVSNPGNPDARGIGRREIAALFPGCAVTLKTVTLAPPLTRAIAGYCLPACRLLAAVPCLRTHYLGAIRKRAS